MTTPPNHNTADQSGADERLIGKFAGFIGRESDPVGGYTRQDDMAAMMVTPCFDMPSEASSWAIEKRISLDFVSKISKGKN